MRVVTSFDTKKLIWMDTKRKTRIRDWALQYNQYCNFYAADGLPFTAVDFANTDKGETNA